MSRTPKKALQNTLRNDLDANLVVVNRKIESVATWMAAYFEFEVLDLVQYDAQRRPIYLA